MSDYDPARHAQNKPYELLCYEDMYERYKRHTVIYRDDERFRYNTSSEGSPTSWYYRAAKFDFVIAKDKSDKVSPTKKEFDNITQADNYFSAVARDPYALVEYKYRTYDFGTFTRNAWKPLIPARKINQIASALDTHPSLPIYYINGFNGGSIYIGAQITPALISELKRTPVVHKDGTDNYEIDYKHFSELAGGLPYRAYFKEDGKPIHPMGVKGNFSVKTLDTKKVAELKAGHSQAKISSFFTTKTAPKDKIHPHSSVLKIEKE